MRMKGKETCLKAMSSVEVGEFGLMSRYSHILFSQASQIISSKDLSTHQGEVPANLAFMKGNTAWTLESGQDDL